MWPSVLDLLLFLRSRYAASGGYPACCEKNRTPVADSNALSAALCDCCASSLCFTTHSQSSTSDLKSEVDSSPQCQTVVSYTYMTVPPVCRAYIPAGTTLLHPCRQLQSRYQNLGNLERFIQAGDWCCPQLLVFAAGECGSHPTWDGRDVMDFGDRSLVTW